MEIWVCMNEVKTFIFCKLWVTWSWALFSPLEAEHSFLDPIVVIFWSYLMYKTCYLLGKLLTLEDFRRIQNQYWCKPHKLLKIVRTRFQVTFSYNNALCSLALSLKADIRSDFIHWTTQSSPPSEKERKPTHLVKGVTQIWAWIFHLLKGYHLGEEGGG